MTKRFLDVAISLLGLSVATLPMAVIYLLVMIKMGSPVLFRQRRCGLHCRPFVMVKFRTMEEVYDTQGVSLPDDERLSSFGRFLRRFRLDELPELWNVLRGDMSLIGPRPLLPKAFPDHPLIWCKRHAIHPGLTGWAQVNGNTNLDLETKVALDLWYITYASWRLDLQIMYRTLTTLVFGERINENAVREAMRLANCSGWYS